MVMRLMRASLVLTALLCRWPGKRIQKTLVRYPVLLPVALCRSCNPEIQLPSRCTMAFKMYTVPSC